MDALSAKRFGIVGRARLGNFSRVDVPLTMRGSRTVVIGRCKRWGRRKERSRQNSKFEKSCRNDLATLSLAEPCPHLVRDIIFCRFNHFHSYVLFVDYATFAHPSFDANDYANAILAAQPYRITITTGTADANPKGSSMTTTTVGIIDSAGTNKEEISIALAKLSFGIDDINRQLKNVINAHHEALLSQAASVNQLEGSLQHVNAGLKDIAGNVTRCVLLSTCPVPSDIKPQSANETLGSIYRTTDPRHKTTETANRLRCSEARRQVLYAQ